MAKNFRELKDKMSPESRARASKKADEMLKEMLLSELRQLTGMTQQELADALQIKQPTLSRMESQGDMQVSTLQRLVHALGGEVEIIVHLPQGDVRLTQFDDAA